MRSPAALAVLLAACGFEIKPSSAEVDAPPFVDDGGGLSAPVIVRSPPGGAAEPAS